jgi:hypothetical protein
MSSYLSDNILVGESNDQAILGSVVLVLILDNQAAAGIVISPSLTTPAEFNLVTLEVRFVLDNFNKTLQ